MSFLGGIVGGVLGTFLVFIVMTAREMWFLRTRARPTVLRFLSDRGGQAPARDVYGLIGWDELGIIGGLMKLGAITVDQVPPREIILTDVGRSLLSSH